MRVLILAACLLLLGLTACGTEPPSATPVIIVITATPAPVPPTPPPPTVPPSSPTPDTTATAQALALATAAQANADRATAAAQVFATQTREAQVVAQATGTAVAAVSATAAAQPTPTAAPPRGIDLTKLSKGFHTADYMAGDAGDTITFTAVFVNHLGKDVRAFKGRVKFFDVFNTSIMNMTVSITDPIKAGKSLTWNGELDYNQFMDDDRKLKNTNGKDLVYEFQLLHVIYSDGSEEDFDTGVQ